MSAPPPDASTLDWLLGGRDCTFHLHGGEVIQGRVRRWAGTVYAPTALHVDTRNSEPYGVIVIPWTAIAYYVESF